jgi:hypothetical protein
MIAAAQPDDDSVKRQLSICVVDLVTSDEDRRFAPAGRMAAAIIELTQENGGWRPSRACGSANRHDRFRTAISTVIAVRL